MSCRLPLLPDGRPCLRPQSAYPPELVLLRYNGLSNSYRSPLLACCSAFSCQWLAHADRLHSGRLVCLQCSAALDRPHDWTTAVHPQASHALTQLERLLRKALDGHGILMRGRQLVRSDALMLFVEDVTWALMRPLVGTRHRILHAMQTPPFRVPSGLNKPMEVNSWLSFGCLDLRRCILAVIGTLLLPEIYCGLRAPNKMEVVAEQSEGTSLFRRFEQPARSSCFLGPARVPASSLSTEQPHSTG